MDSTIDILAELLRQTREAHHQAFIANDGLDPDWAIWYADYLYDRLPALLGVRLDKSELIYVFKQLDYEQQFSLAGADWAHSYARKLLMRYPAPARTLQAEIPYLTTEQMIEVDRAMTEEYRIELIQMMENAGRNLAHLARERFLDSDPRGKGVVVLAGTGGNGGGALVCARHLHNWGAVVHVYVTEAIDRFAPIPRHQCDIVTRMRISVEPASAIENAARPDLIVDGIIGYSLKGAPRESAARLIRWANASGAPVLALDVPSGIDAAEGVVFEPAIRAAATLTLALPKAGLAVNGAQSHVGELYLADIGVPPQLYAEPPLALDVGHIFAQTEIVRLR